MEYNIGDVVQLSMGRGYGFIKDIKEQDGITVYLVRMGATNELITTVDDHIIATRASATTQERKEEFDAIEYWNTQQEQLRKEFSVNIVVTVNINIDVPQMELFIKEQLEQSQFIVEVVGQSEDHVEELL